MVCHLDRQEPLDRNYKQTDTKDTSQICFSLLPWLKNLTTIQLFLTPAFLTNPSSPPTGRAGTDLLNKKKNIKTIHLAIPNSPPNCKKMGYRPFVVLLILALAIAAQSQSTPFDASWGLTEVGHGGRGDLFNFDGLVGDFIGDNEMLMDNEASRRHLAGRRKLSYGMLKGSNVPCNQRGKSYYNCQQGGRANPYRRGCNQITRCARNTN
ncbi:Rapid ALkalinization Factor [Dillenia turbinata]|uniref:Rapid ALkalinization Factor n=1 Tax=Dillenia turbinata TaxID=194707 RepID=A0AAN8VN73_9MAGN